MHSLHAVIMAGGTGSRFWPLSTPQKPKQLLCLADPSRSLLRSTFDRIAAWVGVERMWVVTAEHLRHAVAEELEELPADHVLGEPVGRNTAACIGWAASHIAALDPEALLVILPADHTIAQPEAWRTALQRAVEHAAHGALVTVGVQPTRAETGYGYLQLGATLGEGIWRVARFVEKPDAATAQRFLAEGERYLWNSGVFVFQATRILQAIADHLPQLAAQLQTIADAAARHEESAAVNAVYPGMQSISIDHGVMEKSEDLLAVRGEFGWSDLGSWQTAWELAPKDAAQNALCAVNTAQLDCSGCYVQAPADKNVMLIGLHDVVVVDTPAGLLVMHREQAQRVRQAAEAFAERTTTG